MSERKTDRAEASLERTLSFFERAESKASFLFALDTAMIALLCLNLRPSDLSIWYIDVLAGLTGALILGSLTYIYRCIFPSLKGGHESLIYFREIARRTEARYIEAFENGSEEEYRRDLLGQVWRNSEILKLKFDSVKIAFLLTAFALLPWTGYLLAAATLHSQIPAVR